MATTTFTLDTKIYLPMILDFIEGEIDHRDHNWLNIMLVCKEWSKIGNEVFSLKPRNKLLLIKTEIYCQLQIHYSGEPQRIDAVKDLPSCIERKGSNIESEYNWIIPASMITNLKEVERVVQSGLLVKYPRFSHKYKNRSITPEYRTIVIPSCSVLDHNERDKVFTVEPFEQMTDRVSVLDHIWTIDNLNLRGKTYPERADTDNTFLHNMLQTSKITPTQMRDNMSEGVLERVRILKRKGITRINIFFDYIKVRLDAKTETITLYEQARLAYGSEYATGSELFIFNNLIRKDYTVVYKAVDITCSIPKRQ